MEDVRKICENEKDKWESHLPWVYKDSSIIRRPESDGLRYS